MEKGRMIYVDESGKKLVTRMLICDMRPVRSSCGMHIVNTFRYGGLRSAEEFLCFARRFAELYEENEGEKEDELVREVLPGEGRTFAVPGKTAMENGYGKSAGAAVDAAALWLEPESCCYVICGDAMTIYCGLEPAETVYRRADAFEPPVDECEFVTIMENLKSGEGISAPAQDLIVHLLGLLMRDWGGEISYYVYDLDFGRKFEPGLLSDRDGYVDLSCDQALYRDLARTGF